MSMIGKKLAPRRSGVTLVATNAAGYSSLPRGLVVRVVPQKNRGARI